MPGGPSRYTVQDGDTLAAIAQKLWGDSSFWYMIAEANGLDGTEALPAGMSLIIPGKIHNIHNTQATYKVYDPNKIAGDNTPYIPKPVPPPKETSSGGGCGILGQIIVAVVAVAVSIVTAGAALAALGVYASVGAGIAAVATGAAFGAAAATIGTVGTIAVGAGAAALGSIVSQGVGLAIGAQDKFSWSAVGLAAIAGGVGAGIGSTGVGGAISKSLGGGFGADFAAGAITGVAGNVLSQGIGVATGLQSKFDWAGVAAAGVGGGVTNAVGNSLTGHLDLGSSNLNAIGIDVVSGAAGLIANAATRSLISGTDFGDNIMAALPDTIAQTIGNAFGRSVAESDLADQYRAKGLSNDLAEALANGKVTGDFSDLEALPIGNNLLGLRDPLGPVIITPIVNTDDPFNFVDQFGTDVGLRVLALVHQSPTLMSALDEIKAAGGDVATKNALGENLELQDAAHTEYLEGAGPPFISIGPSSRTDPEDVALWIVQTLSHEVGHALYSAPDKSSKILYVQSQLDSEGAATVSNIIIGNEFEANGIDIGVAGNQNNKPYYEQQFGLLGDGSQSYAETIRNIGVRYGASEKSSAPGNPIYRVFYENQYDTKIAPHLPH